MSKEYTYSMPESFMKDQSVPARWRVLGIINGFAIAGKPCYASNEWFAKELNCSIHTISNAFSELEEKEEIHCIRTKRTRVAYRIKPEIETNFHLRPQPTEHSDRNQLNTISDSISDSKSSASEDGLRVVETSSEEGERPRAAKDLQLEIAAKYWLAKCKEECDFVPVGGLSKPMFFVKEAHKYLKYPQIREMMNNWFQEQSLETHEMIQISRCLSKFQIDKYLAENV